LTALLTSDRTEKILHRLSKAIHSAIIDNMSRRKESIPHVLHDMIWLETRPVCLMKVAFDCYSAICENRQTLRDWESLLFDSLEFSFRHLDPQVPPVLQRVNRVEDYQEIADVVFGSQKSEAIADFLHAWTVYHPHSDPDYFLEKRLVCLHNLVPFSPRLRRLVIRSVERTCYRQFERVGVKRFVALLNYLHVTVEDMDSRVNWLDLLLATLQTSRGTQHLSHWYWEILVELAISWSPWSYCGVTYNPKITTSLAEAQEWSKLECWMGTICVLWPPETNGITEEDLGHLTLLLSRERPGLFEKLKQWMEQWSQTNHKKIPESFQRICKQEQGAAQRDTL